MKKFIAIDRPRGGVPVRRYAGWLEVSGWAAAAEPIVDIRARADGGEWVRATYSQPRPDVQAAHPSLAGAGRAGFQAFVPVTGDVRAIEVVASAGARRRATVSATAPIASEIRDIEVSDSDPQNCPWCGQATVRFEEPVQRGPFRLVSCGRCDFGFADPVPALGAMGAIYETEYWDESVQGPDVLSPSVDTELVHGFLQRFGNGGKRVLEVGCGQGTLLYGLKGKGLDVAGQDLSHNAARALEEHHGVRIWRQAIGSVETDERYDCIVTRHVIEHSITPAEDVQWMCDHLAPGGVLVILTPNRRSLAAELFGATWEWFVPPIHVGYFGPRSFELKAAQLGLDLRVLTTREGDGAPLLPTLESFAAFENERLSPWRRARCEELLAHGAGGFETMMAQGGGVAGLGQELICVLVAS